MNLSHEEVTGVKISGPFEQRGSQRKTAIY
jgi:hypothetical protein